VSELMFLNRKLDLGKSFL